VATEGWSGPNAFSKIASGAKSHRGGADHAPKEFNLCGRYLFSSILIPPLSPQDQSRTAILELKPFPPSVATALPVIGGFWGEIGADLRRRSLDQWPRFEHTLASYRLALAKVGHGGRGADVFGTLLACADVLLYDDVTAPEFASAWAAPFSPSELGEATTPFDHERLLDHLTTTPLEVRRGSTHSISGIIFKAADLAPSDGPITVSPVDANRILGKHGLRVVSRRDGSGQALAVASSHSALAKLFEGTHWAQSSGTSGGWVQAISRVQGARKRTTRFVVGEKPRSAYHVPIEAVIDPDGGEEED